MTISIITGTGKIEVYQQSTGTGTTGVWYGTVTPMVENSGCDS